jgi:hypothetical protein
MREFWAGCMAPSAKDVSFTFIGKIGSATPGLTLPPSFGGKAGYSHSCENEYALGKWRTDLSSPFARVRTRQSRYYR